MDTQLSTPTGQAAVTLQGRVVGPGVAFGAVILRLDDFSDISLRRLDDSEIGLEMGRAESAARAARVSLVRQRDALASRFSEDQQRIFDAHLKILEDPAVETDIRNRIRQGMNLEAAVREVLEVYERLCEVVETEGMRNRLSDLRDVAWRLLQHCERGRADGEETPEPQVAAGGILVVKDLSVSDLTEALEIGATAIVALAGTPGSHGSILARAAGLPAVIRVDGVLDAAAQAQTILVDGQTGQILFDPPAELVSSALGTVAETQPAEELQPAVLADGTQVHLEAAVASPAEARRAVHMGVRHFGLYRTELPVIKRQGFPREDSLTVFHKQVLRAAETVLFRLPDLDSTLGLDKLCPGPEANPMLGCRGVRLLLNEPAMLGVQLRAILRASEGRPVQVAAPFVTDLGEIADLRDAIDNAREELRLEGIDVSNPIQLGVVLETPAAALLGREMLAVADFAVIGLDTLAQHLLSADASHGEPKVANLAIKPHPVVLRAVRKLVQMAEGLDKELRVYGECIGQSAYLLLLVGVGVRHIALRPGLLNDAQATLHGLDLDLVERVSERACRATSPAGLAAALPADWS